MSNPHKRQEFEDYLRLEMHNTKESKSLLYLLPFSIDIFSYKG